MLTPPARRKGLLALALLPAALIIASGTLSFQRKIASFQPLGFRAHLTEGHWLVTAVETPETGLRPGDRIVLVNGEGFGRIGELRETLRRRPASELLVLRGGRLEEIPYGRPRLRIDFPYLILAPIAVGYLLVGFFTLTKDRRRPALLFFLWCLASAAVYLLTPAPPFDPAGKAIYVLEELARLLLPPVMLHLFLSFPAPLARSPRTRRAIPFLYLPAAVLATLQADLIFFDGRWLFPRGATAAVLESLDRLELYHLAAFALAAIAVLLRRLRRTRSREHHRQVAWIAVGLAGGYLPFLALYVGPLALGVRWPALLGSLAVLPLAIVPVTFAYAILRYKLWDIGVIVRDTIALTLTLLLGVFGFSLANLIIDRGIPEQFTLTRHLLLFLAGLAIAGVLIPTKRGLSSSFERLQYRGRYRKRRALADFGREVLRERDLGRLCSRLLRRLEEGLELRRVNLFLNHEGLLVPVQREPGLEDFLETDELPSGLWSREVQGLSAGALPSGPPPPLQRLFADGYRYAFPLTVRGGRIGLLVAGYKEGDVPLSSDDVDLIRGLLNQAALAIDNARLLDEVQRQLEEVVRLQRHNQGIIESSPAGIAVIDRQGRIVSANRAFGALAGMEQSQLAGKELRAVLPVQPLPEPGEGILEVSYCEPTGREHHLQMSRAELKEEDPGERQVLVVQDVSERVAMENALKEKDRLAALGMLAAGVAHEVNTPITGISSYAQMLLAETPESDPRFELLRKVERQTFRASRIVNNLLEFARNRSDEMRRVSIGPLVGECLELLGERLDQKGIELRWDPPASELAVVGNEGELQQVFTNLFLNAVDAMGRTGGTLTVRAAADGGQVRVEVEDTGPGIPEGELDKIFQPFYSTKLAQGGTGLGLSISYNIIRRHGGDLRVESRPGEGCRFTVELPHGQSGGGTSRP